MVISWVTHEQSSYAAKSPAKHDYSRLNGGNEILAWSAMDWNSLLSAIAIIVFIVLMMRGCGGMMAGGTPATQWRRQRRQIASRETSGTVESSYMFDRTTPGRHTK